MAGLTGGPPLQLSQVRDSAVLATMLTPVAVGFILPRADYVRHAVLQRRQLAAWDAEWQETELHRTKGR